MNQLIYFAKVKPEAIIPSKRVEDGAFDIYACFEEDYMTIEPHETKLIPTGIASACDTDYCIILRERGMGFEARAPFSFAAPLSAAYEVYDRRRQKNFAGQPEKYSFFPKFPL